MNKRFLSTLSILLVALAALAEGKTTIENAAKEPHIVDVANFLNSMGANIKGAGTDVIRVRGVEKLHGAEYTIIPDQIEAGTFMAMAVATRGNILIKNVIPKHLESISSKLTDMGAKVIEYDDSVRVMADGKLKAKELEEAQNEIKAIGEVEFSVENYDKIQENVSELKRSLAVSAEKYRSTRTSIEQLKKIHKQAHPKG